MQLHPNTIPGPALIALLCAYLLGCSESTTHGTVNGVVTFDGQALKEGVIRFVPTDGASPTASAPIVDGTFTAVVPIGIARIECSAPHVTGKQKMYDTPDSPEVDIVGELLPPRYNVQSELQLDVTPGKLEHTLSLSSE